MAIEWEFHPKYGKREPLGDFADIVIMRDGVPYVGQVVSRDHAEAKLQRDGYFFDHDGMMVPDLSAPTITRALEKLVDDGLFEDIFQPED
ncbi:MAG: hypothetical protein ABIA93_00185 [Candidatus Woesearchaeota archaeon]